jgi:hypothetical protein
MSRTRRSGLDRGTLEDWSPKLPQLHCVNCLLAHQWHTPNSPMPARRRARRGCASGVGSGIGLSLTMFNRMR